MALNETELAVNPIVAKISRAAAGEPVTQLVGYVGEGVNGAVRLYPDLTLAEYIEFSADAVLCVIDATGCDDGRVRVFVKASTEVVYVATQRTRTRAGHLGGAQARIPVMWKPPKALRFLGQGAYLVKPGTDCASLSNSIADLWAELSDASTLDEQSAILSKISRLTDDFERDCVLGVYAPPM